jgi:hypothetical protein
MKFFSFFYSLGRRVVDNFDIILILFQINLNLNYLQYCDVSSFEEDFVEHKDK